MTWPTWDDVADTGDAPYDEHMSNRVGPHQYRGGQ